jgi:hypothetical protein
MIADEQEGWLPDYFDDDVQGTVPVKQICAFVWPAA